MQTVRLAVDGRVLMAGQRRVAQPTTEMVHVPTGPFGRRVFRRENQLVARFTARDFHLLGVMPAAEHLLVDEKVNQIRQHFL